MLPLEFHVWNEFFDALNAKVFEQTNNAREIQARRVYSRDCHGFEVPIRHHLDQSSRFELLIGITGVGPKLRVSSSVKT